MAWRIAENRHNHEYQNCAHVITPKVEVVGVDYLGNLPLVCFKILKLIIYSNTEIQSTNYKCRTKSPSGKCHIFSTTHAAIDIFYYHLKVSYVQMITY